MEILVNTCGCFPVFLVEKWVFTHNKRFLNCYLYAWALAETSWESLMASIGMSSVVSRGNINHFLFKHHQSVLCSAVQNPKHRQCLY